MSRLEEEASQKEVEEAVGISGPDAAPEDPPQPKAWQVGYADLGTFSMIGTSQKSVAGAIMHLREKFYDQPDTLVPIEILAINGKEDITWVFPALITGVFNQTPDLRKLPRNDPGGFAKALKEVIGEQGPQGLPEGVTVAVVDPGDEGGDHG